MRMPQKFQISPAGRECRGLLMISGPVRIPADMPIKEFMLHSISIKDNEGYPVAGANGQSGYL